MALPSVTVMREAKWIAYYLREGTHPEDLLPMWERRFPDLPISRYVNAMKYAQRMLRVGAAAAQLPETAQLRQALGRGTAPDPMVSVDVLFHWTDSEGRDYWNTIRVATEWTATIADIVAKAQVAIGEIMGRYPGSVQQGWEIVPSILWPSGEQL